MKVLLLVSTCLALAQSGLSSEVIEVPRDDDLSFRLPTNTRPLHYFVQLTTDIDKGLFNFTGVVQILIEALEDTSEITLHYRQITIEQVNLWSSGENPVPIEQDISYTQDELREFLRIPTADVLVVRQQYIVEVTYSGVLRNDNFGFLRASYRDADGEIHWLATTQFQPTDARHAFPCYDEPGIRARFTIELRHDVTYYVVSNMPVASVTAEDETGYYITRFEETPTVQTYIIGILLSDFESISSLGTIYQRIFAKPDSITLGEGAFGLEAAERTLAVIEDYLNMTYPLTKKDLVAVPDFAYGAQNWGICVFREEFLLFDEQLGTRRERDTIVRLLAHEYFHNWIGNLISPRWWSFVWLNEGFANFYERFIADLVWPGDRHLDLFVLNSVQGAFQEDAHPDVRAMTNEVETPEEIFSQFDTIAYAKSGSVLRMMQVAMGLEAWNLGIHYYLLSFEFLSVVPEDFYVTLQAAVDETFAGEQWNISIIFQSWEYQSGFPLVTVSKSGDELTFTQTRFFYSDLTSESLWWIPISYTTQSNPNFDDVSADFWIEGERSVVITNETAPKPWSEDDWILANLQETGYYRVNYDEGNWELLIDQLHSEDFEVIHVLNRAQLVDDSLNLARAEIISYETAFRLLEYLHQEVDYAPWSAADRNILLLDRWLQGTAAYENFRAFVRRIVEPIYSHYGTEVIADEHNFDRFARSLAINLACSSGVESCLTQISEIFESVVYNEEVISPDVQLAIYCNGLSAANSTAFNFLLNRMLQSEYQAERTLLQTALGCANDAETLTQYLEQALHPGDERLLIHERLRIFSTPVNSNALGLQVMMDFVRENFEAIDEISPGSSNTILSNISIRVATEEVSEAFEALLRELEESGHVTEDFGRSLRANVNNIFEWQEKFAEEIRIFLQ